jgi:hypothetical protein
MEKTTQSFVWFNMRKHPKFRMVSQWKKIAPQVTCNLEILTKLAPASMVKLVKLQTRVFTLINSKIDKKKKVKLKLIAVVITLGTVPVTRSGFNFAWKIIYNFLPQEYGVSHSFIDIFYFKIHRGHLFVWKPVNATIILCSDLFRDLFWNYNEFFYLRFPYFVHTCLSPIKLWVRPLFMSRCTRYNIMW